MLTAKAGRESLALHLVLPLLGMVAVFVAALRHSDFGCHGSDSGGHVAVTVIATVAFSTLALLGAGRRLEALEQVGRSVWSPPGLVAAASLWVALVALFALLPDARLPVFVAFFAGTCLTGVLGISLLVALVAERTVDEAGLLVPAYLLGAGMIVYPTMAIASFTLSGLGC